MNYELARELKESGFPFHGIAEGKEAWDGKVYIEEGTLLAYALPTLEELIEACTNTMEEKCIYRLEYDWFERSWEANAGTADEHYKSYGKTPTEAVARLWLALKANIPTV